MKNRSKFFLTIAIVISAFSYALGATYYVDARGGNDSNNGTSPSSAWKTIAKVNNRTFSPGDQILFKRGEIWTEKLIVSSSGTSASPITYADYGTGTKPTIDGKLSKPNNIEVTGKSYVIVKNFNLKGSYGTGPSAAVLVKSVSNVTISDMDIYITGRGGIFIQSSTRAVIARNKMTTPNTYYNMQTDGIYAQRNNYNIYDGNHVVISNQHLDQHNDGIQMWEESNGTVRNNYFEQNNTKGGNAQGIYVEKPSGVFYIYNNVCYGMYTTSSLLKFKNYTYGSTGRAVVYGNSLYGGKGNLLQTDDPNIIFKNNIIQTTGSTTAARFEKAISNPSNVNNNIYRRGGTGDVILYNGTGGTAYRTINEWKALGFDSQGSESDPMFNNPGSRDFSLKSGSPAVDRGATLPSPYNTDKNGNPRPSGSGFDIGALEMGSSGGGTGTAASLQLNVKIFLEGPYTNGYMKQVLGQRLFYPLSQPYGIAPWNYGGTEKVTAPPVSAVDWVIVELRTGTAASTIVKRKAAMLKANGYIMDIYGNDKLTFPNLAPGKYYVVIRHRNHLDVMSSVALTLGEVSAVYDFSTGANKAYGSAALKMMADGKYAMYAGDANADGKINSIDKSSLWQPQFLAGKDGYLSADYNLDGAVTAADNNLFFLKNQGKVSTVSQ